MIYFTSNWLKNRNLSQTEWFLKHIKGSVRVKSSDFFVFIVSDLTTFLQLLYQSHCAKTAKLEVCSMKTFRDTSQEVTRGCRKLQTNAETHTTLKGHNFKSISGIFVEFSLLKLRVSGLSNESKMRNVGHTWAKLCVTQKLKKCYAVSFLTSKKSILDSIDVLIFVGVKVLLGAYLKNKFEWVDIITRLTTASQSHSRWIFVNTWNRLYYIVG